MEICENLEVTTSEEVNNFLKELESPIKTSSLYEPSPRFNFKYNKLLQRNKEVLAEKS